MAVREPKRQRTWPVRTMTLFFAPGAERVSANIVRARSRLDLLVGGHRWRLLVYLVQSSTKAIYFPNRTPRVGWGLL